MNAKQTARTIAAMNTALRDEFLAAIQASRWQMLTPTDTVTPHQHPRFFVMGLAFWSRPDLRALKRLAEELNGETVPVLAFDVDTFGASDGIQAFLPSVSLPKTTPIIAEYSGGTLTRFMEGQAAIGWLRSQPNI